MHFVFTFEVAEFIEILLYLITLINIHSRFVEVFVVHLIDMVEIMK